MTEQPHDGISTAQSKAPGFFGLIARSWTRISPRLVPVLAVITAFLAGIPLIMISGRGLDTAGRAYGALIEGVIGVAINDVATVDDFDIAREYSSFATISSSRLSRQARPFNRLAEIGVDRTREFKTFLETYPTLDEDQIKDYAERIPVIREIGGHNLQEMTNTLAALNELERADVRELTDGIDEIQKLSGDILEAKAVFWPALAEMDSGERGTALDHLKIVGQYGLVALTRDLEALNTLEGMGITLFSKDADTIIDIAEVTYGDVTDAIETLDELDAAGISDPGRLGIQLSVLGKLYDGGYLQAETVNETFDTRFETVLKDNLIILRPDQNLVLVADGKGSSVVGTVRDSQNLPVLYVHFGNKALLFLPGVMEDTIVNSIRFILAGLAVALGFRAGLFNVGAEGQVYAGAILAVWVGFSPTFSHLPGIIHVPLLFVVGMLGGFLWGAVPGVLKAFTGAHEVITTIMMNYIAIRLVDWLIKSKDPVLLGDTESSVPKTPDIVSSAQLPTFNNLSVFVFILIALVVVAILLWPRRKQLDQRTLIRAAVIGVTIILGGMLLSAITVRGRLHIGFLAMLAAVWLTDWFIEHTTPGFELRTVGSNPNAARYAGISVARNIALAMALSGMLAGLVGMIEVTGKQYNLLPGYFGGAGFDAIAVALIARTNPKSMIWAGLLWGGLLSGAGLMQIRADISIDLVKIIQALIIMFISADQIIRFIYRIPKGGEDKELIFSTGWGG